MERMSSLSPCLTLFHVSEGLNSVESGLALDGAEDILMFQKD